MVKSLFYDELRQAILGLEAEKKELRLCLGHWKAEKQREERQGEFPGRHLVVGLGVCLMQELLLLIFLGYHSE
jgi:hypothetical protein